MPQYITYTLPNGSTAYGTITDEALVIMTAEEIATKDSPTGATFVISPTHPVIPVPAPTPAQQAAALIAGGLTITSTSTPAINATYPCDANAEALLSYTEDYVTRNNLFPGKTTTIPWFDIAGIPHTLPSTTVFNALASAIADFVAEAQIWGASGGAIGSLPSGAVTIP